MLEPEASYGGKQTVEKLSWTAHYSRVAHNSYEMPTELHSKELNNKRKWLKIGKINNNINKKIIDAFASAREWGPQPSQIIYKISHFNRFQGFI